MAVYKRPENQAARGVYKHRTLDQWFDRMTEGVQVADKYITTAEVLALNTTAIVCVPAPGTGKYAIFDGADVFLDNTGTAYVDDAGEDLVFTYTDKDGAKISNSLDGSLFDGTADALVHAYPLNAAASVVEAAANAPICLWLESGNWITGTSPLKVRVYYRVVNKTSLEAISA